MTDRAIPFVPLPGSYLPAPAGLTPPAVPKPDRAIEVSVWVRGPDLPDPATRARQPFGKRPTVDRAAFAETYGASEDDFKNVLNYVQPLGISRIEDKKDMPSARARRLLGLRGPITAFERAFGVKLALYTQDGKSWLGRQGELQIPLALQGIVLGVFGLDERPIGTRGAPGPKTPQANLPTPPQIADLYGFPKVQATGQCIALMEFGGGYRPKDIDDYFATIPVKRPTLVDVLIPGGKNDPDDNYAPEVILDIDVAGSVAEDATLAVYFAPHTEAGWIEALETAVMDTVRNPGTISISWGAPELGTSNTLTWSALGMAKMRESFAKAALQDVAVLAACGDYGSDCRVGDRRAHVYYPASDQFVIACGGTTIADITQPMAAETAWSRGGGGISEVCAVPGYQQAIVLPVSVNTGQVKRGVPDIAGYADPGFKFLRNGQWFPATGTSVTAPLFAALMARLRVALGQPMGYALPLLYLLRASVFRDIDDAMSDGNSNSFNYAPGYYGGKGWDARTGLGVLEPSNLVTELKK